jgi:hypothetical protein
MKLKLILITPLLAFCLVPYCQSDIRRIDASSLPEEIREISNVLLSVRWTDSTGDHVIVSTGKTHRPSDDVVVRRSELGLPSKRIRDYFKENTPFVCHYLLKNDAAFFLWKTSGSGLPCTIDSKGNNVKSSFIVTDLDNDHSAEIWIIFKAVCIEDETPNAMKIVMYEWNRRYVQTGTRILKDGDTTSGGQYRFDDAFQNSPTVFKEYADKLWRRKAVD